MEKSIITFSANEQNLQKTGGIGCYASDTVSYIEAHFALGENWSGYDSIRAVWFNDYKTISTVLNPNGVCIVPHEVLTSRGKVMVNLVGSVLVSDELSDRLTTFPCEAVKVTAKAKISGSETAAVTPSQFEQFVSIVISEVEKVTGMTAQAETLPAGSQATARYENGILYLGIPQGIQGERGETGADGNGIASVVYNADYTLTLIFDNGEQFTTPPIRGERGPAGADGRDGADGADGVTPNLSIGNVTTLEPSEDAYVTRRGTDDNPIFDFGIPKGDDGTVPDLDLILPTDTASGDIASITDGQSVVPVKSLKVTLEPIQSGSGTPSPDNIRPISGRTECVTEVCGVNLFDKTTADEGYIRDSNGEVTGTLPYMHTDYISVVPNATYYVKTEQANGGWGAWYDADKNYISGATGWINSTLTAPSNAHYMRLTCVSNTSGNLDTFAVNYPSTDTDYHPYQGTTYTTTLGRTVYGGTLDVVSGELVVDRAMIVFDGTESGWQWYGDFQQASISLPTTAKYVSTEATYNCNRLAPIPNASRDSHIGNYVALVNNGASIAFSTANTSLADFKAWANSNNLQFCYELATPQTYQLDPQTISLLHGNNNVWSDGSVVMVYNADVGLYIDKKLGTSGTSTLSMARTLAKSEDTDDTKTVQLAED